MNEKQLLEKGKKLLEDHPVIIERMPGMMLYISVPGVSIMENLVPKDLHWGFFFFNFHDDMLTIVYPEDRQIELGKRLLAEEIEQPGHFESFIKEWQPIDKEYKAFCKRLSKTDLESLSLEELKKLCHEFLEVFKEVWALPLTCTAVAYYSDNHVVSKIIHKYGEKGLKDFTILSTPKKISLAKKEEHDLLGTAVKIKQGEDAQDLIKAHAKEYFWMNINYRDVKGLDVSYFEDRINSIQDPVKQRKKLDNKRREFLMQFEQLIKKNPFTKEENTIAHLIREATIFQDKRKMNNLIGNYYLGKIVEALTKKTGYTFKQISYLSMHELGKLTEFTKEELDKRAKYSVFFVSPKERYTLGDCGDLYSFMNTFDTPDKEVIELKGITASLGKAKGKARIILDPLKPGDFKKGDILIASMTRPDFTHLMKLAGAIVTDEGGITCHAAIVARELGIPCIIGTKVATQGLKSGDDLEVDADNGIVRRL